MMRIDLRIPTPWSWLWQHAWSPPWARPGSSPPHTQSQNHPYQELDQPETQHGSLRRRWDRWEEEHKVKEKEEKKRGEGKGMSWGYGCRRKVKESLLEKSSLVLIMMGEDVLPCKVFRTVPERVGTSWLLLLKTTISHICQILSETSLANPHFISKPHKKEIDGSRGVESNRVLCKS